MFSDAHGGLNRAELREAGFQAQDVVDFSVNTNPFGPPPAVLAALAQYDPSAYPDREALELREGLAQQNRVEINQVLAGNGAAELIWLAARAFLSPGDRALVVSPSFGEYARAAQAGGAAVIEYRAQPPDFHLDVDRLIETIRKAQPKLVFLCNPNNPTGIFLKDEEICAINAACARGILVLDEAYRAFVTGTPFAPPLDENMLVLRSMTKDFAIAGLRLGYAIGRADVIAALKNVQPPWSVNAAAQAAGLACLAEIETVQKTLAQTRILADRLSDELRQLGANVARTTLHYRLVDVSPLAGSEFRRLLLRSRLVVRDCASFGLPHYVRAGTRLEEDNRHLINSWRLLI